MGEKILIVDDNMDIRATTRRVLERHGFVVREAGSGRSALDRLEIDPPALVLLDLMMPEMSGLQVLERMRRNPATAHVPVILLTAVDEDEHVTAGYQFGADYYLSKPCSAKRLLYAIGVVLGRTDLIGGDKGDKDGEVLT
jgi:DNA-binding response OmpR family regulator